MQSFRIVGKRTINFKNNEGGSVIGVKLFALSQEEGVEGFLADSFFFGENNRFYNTVLSMAVPQEVSLDFDRKGKICGFEILKNK